MRRIKLFEQFVNEALNKRKMDDQVFQYGSLIRDAWRPIVMEAQKFQSINFDLENNSDVDQRTLLIKKDLRKGQPVKYQFNLCLCEAGGDWEYPVLYFKVQFEHDYGVRRSDYFDDPKFVWDVKDRSNIDMYNCYAIIPGEDINNLVKTEKGFTAYTDDYITDAGKKDLKITDEQKNKAWKWIDGLLTGLVEERHKMLDEPSIKKMSDPNPEPAPDTISESAKGDEDFVYKGYECKLNYIKVRDSYGASVHKDGEYMFGLKGWLPLENAIKWAKETVDSQIAKNHHIKRAGVFTEGLVSTNLKKVAKKFDNFKDFERHFIHDINHGYYWHLTTDPNFKISQQAGPRDMSSMSDGGVSEKGALMITSDFRYWDDYYNKSGRGVARPYAALIDATELEPSELRQVSRGFGNEVYVEPNAAKRLKVIKVYDIRSARNRERALDRETPSSEQKLRDLYDLVNESEDWQLPYKIKNEGMFYAAYFGKSAIRYRKKKYANVNNGEEVLEMHLDLHPADQHKRMAEKMIKSFLYREGGVAYFSHGRIINVAVYKVLERIKEDENWAVEEEEGYGILVYER